MTQHNNPEERLIIEHELKIWSQYFDDVDSGKKPFEVRKLDRPFGRGDTLYLREWSPIKGYSGRETRKIITYVMVGGQWGLSEGNCILGLTHWQSQDAGEKEGWIAENKKLRLLLKREVEQTGGSWSTYQSIHHLQPINR